MEKIYNTTNMRNLLRLCLGLRAAAMGEEDGTEWGSPVGTGSAWPRYRIRRGKVRRSLGPQIMVVGQGLDTGGGRGEGKD